jgi:hypothetical protein
VLGRLANRFDLQPARAKVRAADVSRRLAVERWWWYGGRCERARRALHVRAAVQGLGPLINVVGFSGVVAIVAGIRVHDPKAKVAWWLFAGGQFLFFSGDVYTYSNPDASFPSLGDALYLAVYPALMAGLLVLVRRRNPRRDPAAVVDALILTIGIGLLSWVFLIAPNIHLGDISWLGKAVSIAYPLGDVLLLAAAIRLAVDAGKRAPAFYLLSSSIVCLLATDSAYNLALLKGTYNHSQLIYDLGWMLVLHPLGRRRPAPVDARPRGAGADSRPRLTSAPARAARRGVPDRSVDPLLQSLGNPDVLVLIVASAVLFLLVVTGWPAWSDRRSGSSRASARFAWPAPSSSAPPATSRSTRPRSRVSAAPGEDLCVHLALLGDAGPVVAPRRRTATGR